MRLFSADEIDRALDESALVNALEAAFRDDIVTPIRHHHSIARPEGNATLLLMPAWTGARAGASLIGTKIVTVFPGNSLRSLPSVMGSYVLMDGASGAPLAVMDGARLTLWRTAAASALAARYLARADASRMLMVGAGALCPFMIRAHMAQRRLTDIAIWNHRPEKAAEVAASLGAQGLPVRSVTDLEQAVGEADIISCATLSQAPVILGKWLTPGTHLDLVGAFNLSMREVDDTALARASVFIDTSAALTEGGDVAVAIKAGAYDPSHVRGDLFALTRGMTAGRQSAEEITLFKSVGTAIEDLAAAQLVWSRVQG
jgi:ornithine cyclodeaminase/alanine dehydrogenase-like protein (mu-crystallin family)